MEEQVFALMLRQALTEYDFTSIDIHDGRAHVTLSREVFTDTTNNGTIEYDFKDPVLVDVLVSLKAYTPTL